MARQQPTSSRRAQETLAGGAGFLKPERCACHPPAWGSLCTPWRVLWVHVSSPKGKPTPSAFRTNTAAYSPRCVIFLFFFFFNATKEMIQKERWCFASSHGFNTWISGSSLHCRIRGAKSHRPTAVLEQLGAALCPQLGPSPLGGQPPALSSHRCSVLSPSGSPCVCLQGSSKDMASGDWWAEAHEGPLGTG